MLDFPAVQNAIQEKRSIFGVPVEITLEGESFHAVNAVVPLFSGNQLIGVLGMSINLDTIIQQIVLNKENSVYENDFISILSTGGVYAASDDISLFGKKIAEVNTHPSLKQITDAQAAHTSGVYEYINRHGEKAIGGVSTFEVWRNTGSFWSVLVSAPLSIAVVASQIAITASPVSAAVVYMSGALEPFGWNYPTLLLVWLITTFAACMLTALVVSTFFPLDLSKDIIYQERLKAGLVKPSTGAQHIELKKGAKLSVGIFLAGVFCVVIYATSISDVVRKPMLEYVSKNIPVYMDKEIDSIKAEAISKLQATADKEQIIAPLESLKSAFLNSKEQLKANSAQGGGAKYSI